MEVNWRQDEGNKLIIKLIDDKGEQEYMLVDNSINFLSETKMVNLHILAGGMTERIISVNFSGIKLVSEPNKEKGISKKIDEEDKIAGSDHCAFARGDAFSDKWLSPRGWSSKKHYFKLRSLLKEENIKDTCPSCGRNIRKGARFCGYCGKTLDDNKEFKNCIHIGCGKTIKASALFCPYCGKKQ
jgi:hypothetical protein